jgi:hypothetical protein
MDVIDVAGMQPVGGEELGNDDHAVGQQQENA